MEWHIIWEGVINVSREKVFSIEIRLGEEVKLIHLLPLQVPVSQIAFSSAPPPQILYNPAQQILTYAGFCPSAASVPHYPSYHLPLQVEYTRCVNASGIHSAILDCFYNGEFCV